VYNGTPWPWESSSFSITEPGIVKRSRKAVDEDSTMMSKILPMMSGAASVLELNWFSYFVWGGY
jgi:hypothetical protein